MQKYECLGSLSRIVLKTYQEKNSSACDDHNKCEDDEVRDEVQTHWQPVHSQLVLGFDLKLRESLLIEM